MTPSASAHLLATLQKDWQVTIESVNGPWTKVKTMGGKEGYVLTANISAAVPLPSQESCVRPVNPILRPMLRSGHGRKGVSHGTSIAGSGARTVLAYGYVAMAAQ